MNKLFEKYNLKVSQEIIDEITSATVNLQKAVKGDIAFYRLNDSDDAHDAFLKRLKEASPSLVVVSQAPRCEMHTPYVVLPFEKFREFQKDLVDNIFPRYKDVKVIGVTGTNGKSTVVHLCHEIFKSVGKRAFTIGTIGIFDGDKELLPCPDATTPSFIDLCRILHSLSDYDFACLEVSSHALHQNRLGDIEILASGWTNLTQDHLDYHKTMEQYFEAKSLIAHSTKHEIIISPDEDELGNRLKNRKLNFKEAKLLKVSSLGDSFKLHYNRKNLSLAKSLCERALDAEIELSDELTLPKGRYNSFRYNKSLYVVDYAHTPDAIENVVTETKKAFPEATIITVFGCGGDRDRTKRPKMLEASLKGSDLVVVTTDNPRSEDPNQIINDTVASNLDKRVSVIVNRADAIANLVKDYEEETIVIIAGKGHEEYQEVNGVKHHFSDIEEVKKAIGKLENENH